MCNNYIWYCTFNFNVYRLIASRLKCNWLWHVDFVSNFQNSLCGSIRILQILRIILPRQLCHLQMTTLFLFYWYVCLSFSFPALLNWAEHLSLCKIVVMRTDISAFVPDLREKAFTLSPLRIILVVDFFVPNLYRFERFSLYLNSSESSIYHRMFNVSNAFSSLIDMNHVIFPFCLLIWWITSIDFLTYWNWAPLYHYI